MTGAILLRKMNPRGEPGRQSKLIGGKRTAERYVSKEKTFGFSGGTEEKNL